MKRNLLLLTAVVLAAVMLSGCVVWPFGVTVNYELEDGVFKAHKNETRIKKDALDFVVTFEFAKEDETRTFEDFEIKVTDKNNKDIEKTPANLTKEVEETEEVIGIEVTIPVVGKENFTISIKLPAPPAEGE